MKGNSIKDNKGKRDKKDVRIISRKKVLFPAIVAAVIAISIGVAITYAQAQNAGLGEIVNSVSPLNPQATIVQGKISSVEGITLSQLANTSTSESIERVNGTSKSVFNDAQAQLSLSHAAPASQNIISATVTNTGTAPFYITGFLIKGGTTIPGTEAGGIQNLDAYVVDTGYSPEVWGNIPKPPVTQPVVLEPGQSYSAYIRGNWLVEATNEPINSFSVGVQYVYDIETTTYKPGNGWSISISDLKLP